MVADDDHPYDGTFILDDNFRILWGYLRRYAFDKIKIDKSIAGSVDRDPQAAALVAGTVAIAQALNISVTVEGVETEDHVRLLKVAGCQYMQGYYYSRPKPLAEVMVFRDVMEARKLTA